MYVYQLHFNGMYLGLVFKVNGSYITAFYTFDMTIDVIAHTIRLEHTPIIGLP